MSWICDVIVVKPGDNLWRISEKCYGYGDLWRRIYDFNAALIGPNPDLIFPGIILKIPANPG